MGGGGACQLAAHGKRCVRGYNTTVRGYRQRRYTHRMPSRMYTITTIKVKAAPCYTTTEHNSHGSACTNQVSMQSDYKNTRRGATLQHAPHPHGMQRTSRDMQRTRTDKRAMSRWRQDCVSTVAGLQPAVYRLELLVRARVGLGLDSGLGWLRACATSSRATGVRLEAGTTTVADLQHAERRLKLPWTGVRHYACRPAARVVAPRAPD